jgi:hypothetical protein
MTAQEMIDVLSKLNPDTPVLMPDMREVVRIVPIDGVVIVTDEED